jgi:acyl-coenzyme A synthetase/AMP-(fatty) acid ligase
MSAQIETIRKNLKEKFKITDTSTFADLVKSKAEVVGDKVFLTSIRDFDKGKDEKYTYRDMDLYSNRLANGMLKLGIKKGDGISIFQINSPEFLFATFAAAIYYRS